MDRKFFAHMKDKFSKKFVPVLPHPLPLLQRKTENAFNIYIYIIHIYNRCKTKVE